ncbi:resuscitation-promoting factor [Citricoccus sp. K5]|uniref:resuscitation-promoting factor n=1 Tax=Citricoccus sp. K5 TaxID=2653135 RepID=UPI0012EF7085|nr:resuscitation-promoting factor [Citricoccus sp. K5]VXB05468.1 putative Resuscitation-promoting factor Rpf2 [Citricoccus sp. K5]
MARVMKGRLAKVIAQVAALALVVGGLVAFVATQRGAEVTASEQTASQVSAGDAGQDGTAPGEGLGESVLQLERASQVTVDLPKVLTVTAGGETTSFATQAATIEQALRENEVSFDEDDQVSPALDTEITQDVDVTVQRVDTGTETTSEEVPFETIEVEDEDLAEGKTSVLAAGTPGEKTTTWTVTTVDGEETDREATSTETVREPAERRIAVGTKKPEPTPSSASSSTDSADSSESSGTSSSSESSETSSASQASAPASGVWQSLAECESGGNWSINTGNGYYGGLQFSASSWAGAGGTQYAPLPHQATPAEQIATAEKLRANGGWGHWPHCSAQLGLR